MFEVIEVATGNPVKVYAVDGDRFLVGTGDTGFTYRDKSLFAPADVPLKKEHPCTFSTMNVCSADLEKMLSDMASGSVPVQLGTTISTRLTDDTEVDLVVTDFNDECIRLESRDCLGVNTSANNLDSYLDKVFSLLPDALKKRIVETERAHLDSKGNRFTKRAKLFVPAASEVFPPDECYGDKGLYQQMDWYKDVHNRVRADCKQGDSHWYWLSSPFSSGSSSFCYVASDGDASYYFASNTRGLAPFGCIISKI